MRHEHEKWMLQALALAEKGRFTARPNPCVGCVIIKNHKIVGQGYHHRAGQPHAEIMALNEAGNEAKGATVYVTLEPCAHTGRTGPCVDALINARIRTVVAAIEDPFSQVAGKGFIRLREAGIEVITGILAKEARALNPGFLSWVERGRPYVRVKMAMSLDGRVGLENGLSQWISSEQSREKVQYWRARSAAIISSSQTVLSDNPSLMVRSAEFLQIPDFEQPIRVIVDRFGKTLLPHLQYWQDGFPTWVFVGESTHIPENLPAHIQCIRREKLAEIIQYLGSEGIQEVLVEAGAIFFGALLQQKLVDETLFFMAPKLLGHEAKGLAKLPRLSDLSESVNWQFIEHTRIGPDLCVRAASLENAYV